MNHFARRQFNLTRLHDLHFRKTDRHLKANGCDHLCSNCLELEFLTSIQIAIAILLIGDISRLLRKRDWKQSEEVV
jgi:hypothetical protein